MSSPNLTVLDGGRILPVSEMHCVLLDAYVTNTRLMGVLAVCASWTIVAPGADRNDPDSWEELNQFFYIDCEETGFETYQQVRGDSEEQALEADRVEEALVCGLGGQRVDLDEHQLRLLLQNWAAFNHQHGIPMPAGYRNYSFLLEPKIEASPEEQYALMQMVCAPIRSDAQAVNYYLMRCFGRDHDGARYLTPAGQPGALPKAGRSQAAPASEETSDADSVPVDLYDDYERATFCRNTIEKRGVYPDGAIDYVCESLVEMNGAYDIVISRVVVRNLKVVAAERVSRMPVSDTEAAMILKKTEYITLFEVFMTEKELEDNIDEFTLGFHTTMSEYENGRLFMTFRPTNDHVDSQVFQLSNDVRGMYFLTRHNQLLLCAYSPADLRYLESTLANSVLAPYFIPSGHFRFIAGGGHDPRTGHYVFQEPILYEFMNSDFEHFEEFLQVISEDE